MIKISQMNEIAASDVASDDLLILHDVSSGNTKKLEIGSLLPYKYYADATLIQSGTDALSIKGLCVAIGTSKKATIVLVNTTGNDTTAYAFLADTDLSAYTNITFEILNGALILVPGTITVTLPSPSNIIAQPNQQIFSGAGTVSFSNGGDIYGAWWGTTITALQAAAVACPSRSTFYLPSSAISLGGTITFTNVDDLVLDGNGGKITQTTNVTKTVSLVNCDRVVVTKLHLYGVGTDFSNASHTNARLLYLDTCTDVTVRESKLENFGHSGIAMATCSNITINGNHIVGPGVAEIAATDNYNFGIVSFTPSDGLIITENIIEECGTGLNIGNDISNLNISNNQILNSRGQHGIYLGSLANSSLTGNLVDYAYYEGIKVSLNGAETITSENISIANNVIRDVGAALGNNGILVGRSGGANSFYDVLISSNVLTDCGGGIYADHCLESSIEGNSINGTTLSYGIYANTFDGKISKNLLNGIYYDSLYVYSPANYNTYVVGNILEDCIDAAAAVKNLIHVVGDGGAYFIADNIAVKGTGSPVNSLTVAGTGTIEILRNRFPSDVDASLAGITITFCEYNRGGAILSENAGTTAAIGSGTAVNHGLRTTPTSVIVTAAETGPTDIYVTEIGATSFKINFGGGGNKSFYWDAKIR